MNEDADSYRPLYHYTPRRNFMNDPNGLVYADGQFFLFHQYNPEGNTWGHMSWNQATSSDLVHWTEDGVALREAEGTMIFSGSAVYDRHNTSGLGTNGRGPLVAIYTGHRVADGWQSQCLAFSNDRGRTWTKYAFNPVLAWEPEFRDPKVFWHAPTKRWILIAVKADQRRVRLYGSPNLKDWTALSTFGPAGLPVDRKPNWECPDLFELPIEGEAGATRWVLHVGMGDGHINGGSGGEYFVGTFDGTTFRNDNPPQTTLWADYGRDNYAAISWDNIRAPKGGRYWIGWMSNWQYANAVPTEVWRNGATLPRVLTLRRFPEGLRLVARPAPQLRRLRAASHRYGPRALAPDREFVPGPAADGDALEIEIHVDIGDANEVGLIVRRGGGQETRIGYDTRHHALFVDRTRSGRSDFHPSFAGRHHGPLPLSDGRVRLHVFVDRASVEVFGNDGATVLTDLIFPNPESRGTAVYALGGTARLLALRVTHLQSAQKREPSLRKAP
jgi:fructan beta-fructosidase